MHRYYEHHDLRVGDWVLRPSRNALERDGRTVELEPKGVQVLLCLADRAGQVVSRDELFRTVWPDTVVTDKVLSRSVSLLRAALGDDARRPSYIRTVSKVGYRLIAEVGPPGERPARRPVPRRLAAAAVLLAVVATGAFHLRRPAADDGPPAVRAVTARTGQERFPALHPEATSVVYAHRPPDGGRWRLWHQPLDGGDAVALTGADRDAWRAAWSPDGDRLVWTECADARLALRIGRVADASLADARTLHTLAIPRCDVDPATTPGPAWSPDGRTVALPLPDPARRGTRIAGIDVESGSRRWLSDPRPGEWDSEPAFGHDRGDLAFVRRASVDGATLVRGDGRTLLAGIARPAGLVAAADRSWLIAADVDGPIDLWSVASDGGQRWRPSRGEEVRHPSVARDGRTVAYESWRRDSDLWTIDVAGRARPMPLSSSRIDAAPSWSPDGERLAFLSLRSGRPALWIARPGNGAPRELSGAATRSAAAWSPDGREVAFVTYDGQGWAVVVADADRGDRTELHRSPEPLAAPSFDARGEVLFASADGGRWSVRSVPTDGGRARLRIGDGAFAARASADGDRLYFTRRGRDGLWRVAATAPDAVAERVLDDLAADDWGNWALDGDAVVYPRRDGATVELVRAVGGEVRAVAKLDGGLPAGFPAWSRHPDRGIVWTRVTLAECDVLVGELAR